MTIFELSIYSPTIEETWKDSGITRLKIDGFPIRDGKSRLRLWFITLASVCLESALFTMRPEALGPSGSYCHLNLPELGSDDSVSSL
jgi:hypothetical protein